MGRRVLDEDKRESLSCAGYKVVHVDGFRAYAPGGKYLGAEHSPAEAWGLCVDHEEGMDEGQEVELTNEERAKQFVCVGVPKLAQEKRAAAIADALDEAEKRGRQAGLDEAESLLGRPVLEALGELKWKECQQSPFEKCLEVLEGVRQSIIRRTEGTGISGDEYTRELSRAQGVLECMAAIRHSQH